MEPAIKQVKYIREVIKPKKRPNDKKCDFIISVGTGESINVHRSKLRKRSTYFDERYPLRFDGELETCHVKDTSFSTVQICIDFFYKYNFTLDMINIEEVAKLATTWRIEGLANRCDTYLCQQLNPANCFEVRHISQRLRKKDVTNESEKYISRNLEEISGGDGVCALDLEEMTSLLCDNPGPRVEFGIPDIKRRDVVVWNILTKWVACDEIEREPLFCDLFQKIPFCFFGSNFVQNMMLEHPLVKECDQCEEYVTTSYLDVLEHRISFKAENDFGFEKTYCNNEDSFIILPFVQRHGKKEIENKINDTIIEKFETIIENSGIKQLNKEDFLYYLRGCKEISEIVRWKAILNWIQYDTSREEEFPELFAEMNLAKFTLDTLQNVVRKNKLVNQFPDCKDALMDALFSRIQT